MGRSDINLLVGTVALVTGASRGIGRGVAVGLARQGARVAATARTMSANEAPQRSSSADPSARPPPGTLSETLADLRQLQPGSIAIAADLADRDNVERVVRQTIDAFGRIDILLNCICRPER